MTSSDTTIRYDSYDMTHISVLFVALSAQDGFEKRGGDSRFATGVMGSSFNRIGKNPHFIPIPTYILFQEITYMVWATHEALSDEQQCLDDDLFDDSSVMTHNI